MNLKNTMSLKSFNYINSQNINPALLEANIEGIAFDSRKVLPQYLFFCLVGEKTDGHDYVSQALEKGALAIIADIKRKDQMPLDASVFFVDDVRKSLAEFAHLFYEKPSTKKPLIGITGTNGKTTVTHLIAQILSLQNHKTGLLGTLGSKIFEKGEISEFLGEGSGRTTPEAPELQELFTKLIEKDCEYLVMEVSSHSLAQERVGACCFQTAIFTNLTQDHLDYHLTMENYFLAKALLFERLAENTFAIINLDDAWAERFIQKINKKVDLWTYSINSAKGMIRATDIEFVDKGIKATIHTPTETGLLDLPLHGSFNLYNALAALTCALIHGMTLNDILQALKKIKPAPGRFQLIKISDDLPTCIIDYAHTPDGLENVLKTARQIVPQGGKLISVFGCGGDRDPTKRPIMGRISSEYADYTIITSDNSRTEDPQQIIADIISGISSLNNISIEADRAEAIQKAINLANSKDIVLVAGKGHETYQIFETKTIHFDDVEETERALKKKIIKSGFSQINTD